MGELKKAYEVTVKGQYHSAEGKNRALKNYGPETFIIPKVVEIENGRRLISKTLEDGSKTQDSIPIMEKCDGLKAAQHVIQRRLLPIRLREKYEDCVSHRTCHIVSYKEIEIPAEKLRDVATLKISEMDLGELKQFCILKELIVLVEQFANLDEARQAVQDELDLQKTGSIAKPVYAGEGSESAPGVKITNPDEDELLQ